MDSLARFAQEMKKSDDLAALEPIEQEPTPAPETELNDDEQRRLSLLIPPLTGRFLPERPARSCFVPFSSGNEQANHGNKGSLPAMDH